MVAVYKRNGGSFTPDYAFTIVLGNSFDIQRKNEVAVPKRFYNVILDLKEPEVKAIGFIMPNGKDDHPVCAFAVPVDRVERETGIDFFYLVDDEIEEWLESTIDMTFWKW
ncbi:MAG TPA: hypothetical protein ENI27_01760 [bacterium]|nr:hypothetical protein [bacterium]